jgi:glycosyltransferase involved in cell wall biosynthesis
VSISVILPTAREFGAVARTLASLGSVLSGSDELIIVVNGKRNVEAFRQECSGKVRVFYESIPGLLGGRHLGLSHAVNEIVVFVDDDIEVGASWREDICCRFNDPDLHLLGGPSLPNVSISCVSFASSFLLTHERGWWCPTLSLLDFGDECFEVDPHFVWGLNFAVRKTSLLAVGGFHPDGVPWELRRFRGDGETAVSDAFAERGWKAIYDPKVAVTHFIPESRLTLEYFERRAYLQGVSDSYARIRRLGAPDVVLQKRSMADRPMWRRLGARLKRAAAIFGKRKAKPVPNAPLSWEEKCVQEAYQQGFAYHQTEVVNDPLLLDWVLRKNYFDYQYPGINFR